MRLNSKAKNLLLTEIDELKKVPDGTTVYPEAQRLIKQAQGKVK